MSYPFASLRISTDSGAAGHPGPVLSVPEAGHNGIKRKEGKMPVWELPGDTGTASRRNGRVPGT